MLKKIIILSLLIVPVIQYGCAKRIAISYEQVEEENLVQIKTKSNISCNGIVKAKQPSFIILQTDRNEKSLTKVAKKNISSILSTPPIYDYQKKIISEWEIQDKQNSKNTVLYAIGGTGLSFGTSFFLGSLIHRGISDSEYRDAVLWTTTGVGTAVGAFLFTRTGKKKDRQASIMEIRERRYAIAKKEMATHKAKHDKVQQELEDMKNDRERQDAEMKRLMKRLKEREKRKEEGDSD